MTYQARQADLTGGAANFFLATPLEEPAVEVFGGVACSVMTRGGSSKAEKRFGYGCVVSGWVGVGWSGLVQLAATGKMRHGRCVEILQTKSSNSPRRLLLGVGRVIFGLGLWAASEVS